MPQYDPITVERMVETLKRIDRQKRRAKKSREEQQFFAGMPNRQTSGNYVPTQQGGMFQTVGQYIPDYEKIGNSLTGALGSYLTGSQADRDEADLGDLQKKETINAIEQLGLSRRGARPENAPSDSTLRGYLGILDPEANVDDLMPGNKVRSTQRLANGNLGLVTDNGVEDTGIPFDYSGQIVTGADGVQNFVGKNGAGRGVATPVQMGEQPDGNVGKTHVNMDMLAPEQNQELADLLDGVSDEAKQNRIVDMYMKANFGSSTSSPSSSKPRDNLLRVQTDAEKAASVEQAKIDVQMNNADRVAVAEANAAGLAAEAKGNAENLVLIRKNLPRAEQELANASSAAQQLLSHPGLNQIVGGAFGRIPDSPTAQKYFNAVMAGTPAANAMALHNQLKGKVFMAAFETLKNGGQITEIEGTKAEQAMARMDRAQTIEGYKKAVTEFIQAVQQGVAKMKAAAAGGSFPSPQQPSPQPALPAGFSWEP